MLISVLNYVLAAAVTAAAILLFMRSALPGASLKTELGKSYDDTALKLKIAALSLASSDNGEKGPVPSIYAVERALKKFFSRTEKRKAKGEPLDDHETMLCRARAKIYAALQRAKQILPSYYFLPHCGKYPRIYEFCRLFICGKDGVLLQGDVRQAIGVFQKQSAFTVGELAALCDTFKLCIVQALSSVAAKSEFARKIRRKAESDVKEEKMDLSYLKYDAYSYFYGEKADRAVWRKYCCLAVENGADVTAMRETYLYELGGYASLCSALIESLARADDVLSDDFVCGVYAESEAVENLVKDYGKLTGNEKMSVIRAIGRYCAKRKLTDKEGIERLKSELGGRADAGQVLAQAAPGAAVLWTFVAASAAVLLGAAIALPFFLPLSSLPLVLLVLPVTAYSWTEAFAMYYRADVRPFLTGETDPSLYEFSSDAAPEKNFSDIRTKKGVRTLSFFRLLYGYIESSGRALAAVYPICALLIVLLAPLRSALWLAAAFLPQAIGAVLGVRNALKAGGSPLGALKGELVQAMELPQNALVGIISATHLTVKGPLRTLLQYATAAMLTATALMMRASAAFYVVAAGFALAPFLTAILRKSSRMTEKYEPPQSENFRRSFDGWGVYPRVHFLNGEKFVCVATDRGTQTDFFDSVRITNDMRIYLHGKNGREPLKSVGPFVTYAGGAVNNSFASNRTFHFETQALREGGKNIELTSHSRGEFVCTVAHALEDGFSMAERDPSSAILKKTEGGREIFVGAFVRKGRLAESITNGMMLKYGVKGGSDNVLALKIESESERAAVVFLAADSLSELKRNMSRLKKQEHCYASMIGAAAISRGKRVSAGCCDIASFLLFGRCRYEDGAPAKYLDLRYNTVLCRMRGDTMVDRLYSRLKQLAALKRFGIGFNTAVIGFFPPLAAVEAENRLRSALQELSFGGGKAVFVNCENDGDLYDKLISSCPEADEIHFIGRTPNPERRSYRRQALPPEKESLLLESRYGGVDANGNGAYGGFGPSGAAENRIVCADGFGTVVRADGSGYTFFGDPRADKLTSEERTLSSLPSEFAVFSESGRVWSATPLPCGEEGETVCRHYTDGTVFECRTNGLYLRQEEYLAEGKRAKVWRITLKNPRKTQRKIKVALCAVPTLGEKREETSSVLKFFKTENGRAAQNVLTERAAYLSCDGAPCACSTSMDAIADECGRIDLENITDGYCRDALIVSCDVRLDGESERTVRFALSDADGFDFSSLSARRESVRPALTPISFDKYNDLLFYRLFYQTRAALYCPTDSDSQAQGESFENALINGAALLPSQTAEMRRSIICACKRRFVGGELLTNIRGGRGTAAASSGAAMFLPIAVARYIDCTDDKDILFERLPYLTRKGEDCAVGERKESLLLHCLRILLSQPRQDDETCFGIDPELLRITAINAFMPLVRDPLRRLKLAELRTAAIKHAENIDLETASVSTAAWAAICGAVKVNKQTLVKRADSSKTLDRLFISAALLARGHTDDAYEIFESVNPLKSGRAICALTDSALPVPSSGIEAATARCLAIEGFFGAKVTGGCLKMSPRLPRSVKKAELRCDFDEAKFTVEIDCSGEGEYSLFSGGIDYHTSSLEISEKLDGKRLMLKRSK